MIPYVAKEDNKWTDVDESKVTANPRFKAFKQFIDMIRNTLQSDVQMLKYIALVKDR